MSPPEPPAPPFFFFALLLRGGEHLRGRRVEHDGGLVAVPPARGTLATLSSFAASSITAKKTGTRTVRSRVGRSGGRTRASSSGSAPWVKKKKAGSRLAGAGSRRRAGGAGTHAGASTRRRSGTRICTDENVCPSRRTRLQQSGNPRPCRCRPRRPTSSRCVYSPSPSKKNCSLAHAGALCPPATRRFGRTSSREVSLTPESAALHAREVATAASQAHQRLTSGMTRDWKKKEPASRDGHVIGRHFEIDLGEKFKSSSSAPRWRRGIIARSRRDCGVERTRS